MGITCLTHPLSSLPTKHGPILIAGTIVWGPEAIFGVNLAGSIQCFIVVSIAPEICRDNKKGRLKQQ